MRSNTRAENRSDADTAPEAPAKPVASWYTPGHSDPIGDRLLMFDNSGAPSLELLRFRSELGQAPGFEEALREQVDRLKDLQHPAFAQVRSVQRLEPDDDLALVSNYTPGRRLSEVLKQTRGPEHAAALIRQLAPALLMLQQQGGGTSHGLLTPDRIVVSPEGRLTIVEHVIGPAIEALGLSAADLQSLGVTLPPGADGAAPQLDAATDWYQLGLVALSVLIGRPVGAEDVPQLAALVESTDAAADGEGGAAPAAVREWLERALQLSGPKLAPGGEAQKALKAVELNQEGGTKSEQPKPKPAAQRLSPFELSLLESNGKNAPQVRTLFGTPTSPVSNVTPRSTPPPAQAPAPDVAARTAAKSADAVLETTSDRGRSDRRVRVLAAAAAVLAVVAGLEAIALVSMARALWSAPGTAVAVQPTAAGEQVIVSSNPANTALGVTVAPDLRWVRVTSPDPKTAAATDGVLRVSSPIELKVFKGSTLLGAASQAGLKLPPGRHDLELVNQPLGYRLPQTVDIAAGQTLLLHVAPEHGWVVLNSTPAAEVLIDGQRVGRTPHGPLPVALGAHTVTFQHASGAKDVQRVTITAGATVRVIGYPRRR